MVVYSEIFCGFCQSLNLPQASVCKRNKSKSNQEHEAKEGHECNLKGACDGCVGHFVGHDNRRDGKQENGNPEVNLGVLVPKLALKEGNSLLEVLGGRQKHGNVSNVSLHLF